MAFGLLEATRDGTPMCSVDVTERYVLELPTQQLPLDRDELFVEMFHVRLQ